MSRITPSARATGETSRASSGGRGGFVIRPADAGRMARSAGSHGRVGVHG